MPHSFRSLLLPAVAALLTLESAARACGCFAPPDPSQPVLQAGERILFAASGNQIEAHIQIQYSGRASEFGWLVPLPSVPKLEIGTDELFTALIGTTGPQFRVSIDAPYCPAPPPPPGGFAFGSDLGVARGDMGAAPGPSPLVVEDTIGPYDYAVLKGDGRQEMLDWLAKNRYFVPAGTDAALAPYIHPGGYFLALKLKSGQSAGDIQPVILRYQSDLPMIPIILTSVAALRDMPVQAWVLGSSRAIPRNYHHTVINEAALDWLRPESGWRGLVTEAVGEAPGRHTFVTEFAGPARVMEGVLDSNGTRFFDLPGLRKTSDAVAFLRGVRARGFAPNAQLFTILARYLPVPNEVMQFGPPVTPGQFYWNIDFYSQRFPNLTFPPFDPAKLADELETKIAKPTLAVAKLFRDYKSLTHLFTTMSPADMNRDPVFSFNPDLPEVSNLHQATLRYGCLGQGQLVLESVKLASGQVIRYGGGRPATQGALPASRRIETLRESGPPEIVVDNAQRIAEALLLPGLAAGGCSVSREPSGGEPALALTAIALLIALGLAMAMRRRG